MPPKIWGAFTYLIGKKFTSFSSWLILLRCRRNEIARCGGDGGGGAFGSCRHTLWTVAGCSTNLAERPARSFLPRYLLMTDVSYQRRVGPPPPKTATGFCLNSALISQHGQGAVCWQYFLFWKPRCNKSWGLTETVQLIRGKMGFSHPSLFLSCPPLLAFSW